MLTITSVHNPKIKAAARLRDARQRQKQRRMVIDGAREIARAAGAGVRLDEVYVCPELVRSDEVRQLVEALAARTSEVFQVTEAVFDKVAFGDRAEGIVAVAGLPNTALADLRLPANPLVAVLEAVEKPGNVGAVLRSADGAGLSALVVADGRTDLYNPAAIRASLGTIFTLPVCEATSADTLAWLRTAGLRIFAARVDGSIPYTEADFRGPAAIVLGSEADGLSAAWRGNAVQAIRLPMLGTADSLNVSVTAAVLFYEALRQREG